MIQKYKNIAIIYGGRGKSYADVLNQRISELADKERLPLRARVIMEKLLTKELLSDVMSLFEETDICVTFLTDDDVYTADGTTQKRLRQNVVFELGMALIKVGRDKCILLSDFNVQDPAFDLPSDMKSLDVRVFDAAGFDGVINDVLDKILQICREEIESLQADSRYFKYDNLFVRDTYFIDYENIFLIKNKKSNNEGKRFLTDTLSGWYDECKSLSHYDEKIMYLFERIGFLPIFGSSSEVVDWLLNSKKLAESYSEQDIRYYGNKKMLDFIDNLKNCIIEYTRIKMEYDAAEQRDYYEDLLEDFLMEPVPEAERVNPLVYVLYYDYLGLTYNRLSEGEEEYIVKAKEAFEAALKYSESVDKNYKIWAGFITYNLARISVKMGELDQAEEYYKRAVKIRGRWLRISKFGLTARNALAYEYFLARINQLEMKRQYNRASAEEIDREFEKIEIEFNDYYNSDERLDCLLSIKDMLSIKRKG